MVQVIHPQLLHHKVMTEDHTVQYLIIIQVQEVVDQVLLEQEDQVQELQEIQEALVVMEQMYHQVFQLL